MSDLTALSGLVDPDAPGWSRVALTDFDNAGREWVRQQMAALGLETRIDGAGNVIGRLPGARPELGSIMTGSHTDTVEGGGRYDGIVGVTAALECVRSLRDSGTRLNHDLLVVNFFSEEPNRFGISCIGSRALTGHIKASDMDRLDSESHSFGHALQQVRVDPSALLTARMDMSKVRAFVELHIEQGPHMEEQGSQIGVVSSITGVKRFQAAFRGRPDHAGTTPMDRRQDAGCAAAGTVLAIEQIASSHADGRGTTGLVTFSPEAVNVVTEVANLWGEFRSPDHAWLDDAVRRFEDAAQQEGRARSVTVELDWLPSESPAVMDDALGTLVAQQADRLGLTRSRLYSGAEHDAAIIAKTVPTAMIFVPSHDGRSHCPEEFTNERDVVAGTNVLLNTILQIDSQYGLD
ncbi:Zn-dependent hydrolase [Streptomyces fuscichromogenes]|uniref:Zn-dependent hydrolase n=1 Tax=Streptomyces fuscichromogenes TaxID=1324013 RepID=UPI0037FF0A2A